MHIYLRLSDIIKKINAYRGVLRRYPRMVNVFDVASYVFYRYKKEYGKKIDEMKLHKLLYFAQRESLIQKDTPMFDATFYGWKFGPVLKEIRGAYKENSFSENLRSDVVNEIELIMDKIFREYADKGSWSLSRLTHGEISWQNSRIGIPEDANGDKPMDIQDIRLDAERIKSRREMLTQLGLS